MFNNELQQINADFTYTKCTIMKRSTILIKQGAV